jgi:hypothetical protein
VVAANQKAGRMGVESCTKGFAIDVSDVSWMFLSVVSVKIKSCDVYHFVA